MNPNAQTYINIYVFILICTFIVYVENYTFLFYTFTRVCIGIYNNDIILFIPLKYTLYHHHYKPMMN